MKALQLLDQWPATTVAAGWIAADGRGDRAGPTSQPLPLASVTKPLFAYAVLVAIEEGTLALNQPLGRAGATIEHLLAHAAGFGDTPDERLFGVGQRRIYSNGGFEVLGQALAQGAGMPVAQYLHEAVVEPLGLAATALTGSPAPRGHQLRRRPPPGGRRVAGPHPDRPLHPGRCHHPPLRRPDRCAPRLRKPEPQPLGSGLRDQGPQVTPLDGHHQQRPDLRPLRPLGHLHLGSTRWPGWPAPPSPTSTFGPWAAQAWPVVLRRRVGPGHGLNSTVHSQNRRSAADVGGSAMNPLATRLSEARARQALRASGLPPSRGGWSGPAAPTTRSTCRIAMWYASTATPTSASAGRRPSTPTCPGGRGPRRQWRSGASWGPTTSSSSASPACPWPTAGPT